MKSIKLFAAAVMILGLLVCGSAASAQKSPAACAKFKIAEVKVFDCIMEEYTVKLTDHYPNIIDVRL